MIIVDTDGDAAPDLLEAADLPDRSGHDLLVACAKEAGRHAAGLAGLDASLGAALANGAKDAKAFDPELLQRIDLLRQEAEGLAKLLGLLAELDTQSDMVDGPRIADCVPTAQQRHRLLT